jgi:DNA-binding XRE family transcriptional regulator
MEAPTLARRTRPDRVAAGAGNWSPRLFREAWERAEASQADFRVKYLAQAADVVPATLYKWREGESEPTVAQALGLARFLGVDLMDLVE